MKANKLIILVLLAAVAGSCGQSPKRQAATTNNEAVVSEQEEQSDEVELDTLVIPRCPENSDIKTDVQILLPAGYRGTEPADFEPMLSEKWYDFYQDSITKKYFLEKATIEIGKFYDACLDDSTTEVHSKRDALILVKGIIPQDKEIFSIPIKKRRIWPNEKYSFSFNGKTYLLRGDGNTIKSGMADYGEGTEKCDEVENYKLYLSEQGKPEQLIIAIPTFNYTFVQILWIGDLDGDGKPDFVFDTSRDYEATSVLLFLSSKAGEGEIVKIAASSSYQFDC